MAFAEAIFMKLRPTAIALICVISYLTYHAIVGEQGLSRWTSLQSEAAELKILHQEKLERRDNLADQITRLYPESLDRDFLEEIARTRFHFVHPDAPSPK